MNGLIDAVELGNDVDQKFCTSTSISVATTCTLPYEKLEAKHSFHQHSVRGSHYFVLQRRACAHIVPSLHQPN